MTPELSFQMLEMIASGVVSQSVSVAAEIGIADMLAHGPHPAFSSHHGTRS